MALSANLIGVLNGKAIALAAAIAIAAAATG